MSVPSRRSSSSQRGVSTVGAVILAALAGVLAALLMMDWMVVEVHTPEPEDVHLKLPLPLLAGRLATAFIPDEALQDVAVPHEVRQHRETTLTALRALVEAPDATLVRVRAEDASVDVTKRGSELVIAVDADDAEVRCTVPLEGVLEALEEWDWETFDPKMAFDILGAASTGELVTVEVDDGTRVAINMW
jgi:hypothetical protein